MTVSREGKWPHVSVGSPPWHCLVFIAWVLAAHPAQPDPSAGTYSDRPPPTRSAIIIPRYAVFSFRAPFSVDVACSSTRGRLGESWTRTTDSPHAWRRHQRHALVWRGKHEGLKGDTWLLRRDEGGPAVPHTFRPTHRLPTQGSSIVDAAAAAAAAAALRTLLQDSGALQDDFIFL